MARETPGNSVVPQLALQHAVMTKLTTDTPREVIQAARKYEDYLRGDRDFNDRCNDIINLAIDMAKVYKSAGTFPGAAAMDALLARVQKVQVIP